MQCFTNPKYLNQGFSRGETNFLQVRLEPPVPLVAGGCHTVDGACHLYRPFSQELRKNIMDAVSSPDVPCDKSLPQLA